MIKLENTELYGWEAAIRGMRNPMNSWERADTVYIPEAFCDDETDWKLAEVCGKVAPIIGPNDHGLMMKLGKGGSVHAKYRRMITVYVDITAPFYWWKEFDTYKIGTVANSCSTMHKIAAKEFAIEDFSNEHLFSFPYEGSGQQVLDKVIYALNYWRGRYLKTGDKSDWWQMIQLLPTSYNQKRTVMMNYEVLTGIYPSRKNHKLDEWQDFCDWIEQLPYSEIITGKDFDMKNYSGTTRRWKRWQNWMNGRESH